MRSMKKNNKIVIRHDEPKKLTDKDYDKRLALLKLSYNYQKEISKNQTQHSKSKIEINYTSYYAIKLLTHNFTFLIHSLFSLLYS